MRSQLVAAILLTAGMAAAGNASTPLVKSHNDVKMIDATESRSEDLVVFGNGHVKYEEAPNYGKKKIFETQLSAQKLRRLTELLNNKQMLAVPARIESQIKVLDGRVDKRLEIRHGGKQQVVEIENFYPQLNSHRPAYPKVLVELECMLQEIRRKAAKLPPPRPEDDWCPDALAQR
jgi:hypothetical protein